MAALTGLFLLSVWSQPTAAKLMENLYSATVDVSSQSQSQRREAITAAFDQVMINVTGQADVLQQPAIVSAKKNVNELLVQYGYARNGSNIQLTATFDGRKLRQLLAANGLPYWGQQRPELLLWVVVEEAGQRRLMGSSDESIFSQQLRAYAKRRALPVQLPLLDLNDAMSVASTDVWGRFLEPVATASQRYDTDGFAIIRISENAQADDPQQRYQLDWSVHTDSHRLRGVVNGDSMDWLAEPFINDLATKMAAEYSVINAQEQQQFTTELIVEALTQWQDVIELESFLGRIPTVEQVKLLRFSNQQSVFAVTVNGPIQHLMQSIQLDGRLRAPDISPFVQAQPQQPVVYRWQGQR